MKKLTTERANELRANGIEQIASICKTHFTTSYFKIATLDEILKNGGRMPEHARFNGYVRGVNGNYIDWNKTARWSQI